MGTTDYMPTLCQVLVLDCLSFILILQGWPSFTCKETETREAEPPAQEQVGMIQVRLKVKSFCLNILHYVNITQACCLLLLEKTEKKKKK